MDTHLSQGSSVWEGPDPQWQAGAGIAAGAGDGAEHGLRSPPLVPEEGKHQ